jgi:hypothetical protein
VSKLSLTLFCALLGLMAVANVGCMRCGQQAAQKAMESALEKASGGKVNIDAGGTAVDLTGLPANLRYTGAKAVSRWTMSGEKGASTVYSFETADPVATVVQFYKNALAGWKNASTAETDKAVIMVYGSQDEKEVVSVTVAPKDEGGTSIVLTYTKNE